MEPLSLRLLPQALSLTNYPPPHPQASSTVTISCQANNITCTSRIRRTSSDRCMSTSGSCSSRGCSSREITSSGFFANSKWCPNSSGCTSSKCTGSICTSSSTRCTSCTNKTARRSKLPAAEQFAHFRGCRHCHAEERHWAQVNPSTRRQPLYHTAYLESKGHHCELTAQPPSQRSLPRHPQT